MKKIISYSVLGALPLFEAVVILYGIIYLLAQQDMRRSANEALMQYAAGAMKKMDAGMPVQEAMNEFEPVDIERSLSPYMIVYDSNRKVIAGNGLLHGKVPVPPNGTFAYAAQNGPHRMSWQPGPGTGSAVILYPCVVDGQQGYLLTGRSMREVEQRERTLAMYVATCLAITLIATFIVLSIIRHKKNRRSATLLTMPQYGKEQKTNAWFAGQ
jgi:hypothetical protein